MKLISVISLGIIMLLSYNQKKVMSRLELLILDSIEIIYLKYQ